MPTPQRIERVQRAVANRQRGVVVLEDICDPHNAAAVFRSCEALGFGQVELIFSREQRFNPLTRGSKIASASTNLWLDIAIHDSTRACIDSLRARGMTIVVTALHDRAVPIDEVQLDEPDLAVVLGNEHRGVSDEAIELADRLVMIPMGGMVQSLNLSVSAAIMLYEITRRRRAMGMDRFLLGEQERQELTARYLARKPGEPLSSEPSGDSPCSM